MAQQPSVRNVAAQPITLGVIIGNRDFFPDVLVGEARKDLVKLFDAAGIKSVMLTPEQTKLGGVETYADARKCADLFKQHRDVIEQFMALKRGKLSLKSHCCEY